MAYDDDDDRPKVIDDDFQPFGAIPERPVSDPPTRMSIDSVSSTPAFTSGMSEELALRRKQSRDNVLFWSKSKLAIALAILITVSTIASLGLAWVEIHISVPTGFDRFTTDFDFLIAFVSAAFAISGIWLIVASRHSHGKTLTLGYKLMRYTIYMMAIQYGIAAISFAFVGLTSLFAMSIIAFVVIGIFGAIFYVVFKFIRQLLGFLRQLEDAMELRGRGYRPDPKSLSTFLRIFGGLSLFVAVGLPVAGLAGATTIIDPLLIPSTIVIALSSITYLIGGTLLHRYKNDPSGFPPH